MFETARPKGFSQRPKGKFAEGGPVKINPKDLKEFFETLKRLDLLERKEYGPWDLSRGADFLNNELNKPTPPKKWWGGPLSGIMQGWEQLTQRQVPGALRGLGQTARPPDSVAPMMPSLSGLMAPPAMSNQPNFNNFPAFSHLQGGFGKMAQGGVPGSGKTRIPGGGNDLQFKSYLGRTLYPDEFYYIPGVKGNPTKSVPPSASEKRTLERNPEIFGRPTAGLLDSDVPGRTDQLPISVAPGSYVIPADVVSGLGQGNTLAGAKLLREILAMNDSPKKAEGGPTEKGIEIVAAGGEFIIPPDVVVRVGGGNELKGHASFDNMVKNIRLQTTKRLSKLPPPRRD